MSLGNIHGFLEDGHVDFEGETVKSVTLERCEQSPKIAINLIVHQNRGLTGAGNTNTETDKPSRNTGNIQVSSTFTSGRTFDITCSAEFYGRVHWFVIDMKG